MKDLSFPARSSSVHVWISLALITPSGVGVTWATDYLTLFSWLSNSIPQLTGFQRGTLLLFQSTHCGTASTLLNHVTLYRHYKTLWTKKKKKDSCKMYKGQKQIWKVQGTCPHYHPSTPNVKGKVEKSICGVKYIFSFLWWAVSNRTLSCAVLFFRNLFQ